MDGVVSICSGSLSETYWQITGLITSTIPVLLVVYHQYPIKIFSFLPKTPDRCTSLTKNSEKLLH